MLTHFDINPHNDGPDSTKTQPSWWNREHAFSGGVGGAILVRDVNASFGGNWLTPGPTGYALVSNGPGILPSWTPIVLAPGASASVNATPADPTGTTSLTGVMMGLGVTITPVTTGRLLIIISGSMKQDTNSSGAAVTLRHGTGAVPTNGSALGGTADSASPAVVLNNIQSSTIGVPFSVQGKVTGLGLNTPVWLDLALTAITSGTASITRLTVTAIEF